MSEGGQRQTGDVVVVADGAARSGLINLLGQGRRGQGSRVTSRTFSLQQYSTEKSSSNQLINVQQQHNIPFKLLLVIYFEIKFPQLCIPYTYYIFTRKCNTK